MTDATDHWAEGLPESNYLLDVVEELGRHPELFDRLDLAAADVWAALLLVQAAAATLEAIQRIVDDVSERYRAAEGLDQRLEYVVWEALRNRTPLGNALDSVHAIADTLSKIAG
jgi:hypothetical protein